MSLKTKLLILLIAPLVLLCGLHILELQRVISGFERTLTAHKVQATQTVVRALDGAISELCQITTNLAHPREIVHAVQIADNAVLYDWSHSFATRVGTVLFADTKGMVLSRAPAEFHFGDDISTKLWFRLTLRDGRYVGLGEVDDALCLVSAQCLRKYDDIPVGVVCAATPLTTVWLAHRTDDRQVLRVTAEGKTILSTPLPSASPPFTPLSVTAEGFASPDAFSLTFLPDPQYRQLLTLKHSTFITGIITAGLTILALSLVLARQIRPYTTIVLSLQDYARKAISLETLHSRLSHLPTPHSIELHDILDALLRMIGTIQSHFRHIQAHADELKTLAHTDALTGLHNRKSIGEILDRDRDYCQKNGLPFSVLMLDIDSFKTINDTFGHQTGDAVLKGVAEILQGHRRKENSVGRWGGEEFLLVAAGLNASQACALAERLRLAVQSGTYPAGITVTVSIGVVQSQPDMSLDALLGLADKALYQAKADGRNAVRGL